MPLNALIAIFGLIGLLLLIVAVRRFRVMNIGSGVFSQKMNEDAVRANPGEAALMRA